MSRLRKTVIPFRWNTIIVSFTQGTAGSVNLASYLTNTENRTITYSVVGTLPTGITLNGSTVSYNGTSPVASASVQFRATSGAFNAESASTSVAITAPTGNTAPTWITGTDLGTVQPGAPFNFTLTATDAQGDPITFVYAAPSVGTVTEQNQTGANRSVLWSGTAPSTPGTYTFDVEPVDVTPLGQVTNLSATANGAASINLTWTAVVNATAYTVERSLTGNSDWTVLSTAVTGASYTANGLTASTQYFFRVRATNATQTGEYSATSSATTSAPAVGLGNYEPAITYEAQPEQYQVFDDGINSPRYNRWMPKLYIAWRNEDQGDFTDANGTPQGTVPFATTLIPTALQYYSFNVATLADRALTTGLNKGFYVKTSGTSANVLVSGRLGTNPPLLQVVTTDGTFDCACTAYACWANKSVTQLNYDTRTQGTLSSSRRGIVQFDLSGVTGTVISATMQLYALTRAGTNTAINVYEADPSPFQVGLKTGDTPEAGLASLFPGDNFGSDSRVIMAGDFTGATAISSSQYSVPRLGTRASFKNEVSIVADPDAPGTSYWRGQFIPIQTSTDSRRQPFDMNKTLMFPDTTRPGNPIDMSTYVDDLYFRMYIMLEDDFDTTVEGNKMGITWDLRFGYWIVDGTSPNGGYWQNVGGNGGNPGDGTHTYPFTDSRVTNAHIYRGNMQRMEGGVAIADGPYQLYRPWLGYNYETTTPLYPDQIAYSDIRDVKFARGVWYCIEQRCRMNTLTGTPDANGNLTPVADGLLETWINGLKVSSQGNYSWRCHPAMGIQGVNSNWYMGGQASHPVDEGNMHFRLNHFVVASQYIGPRVKP